MSPSISDPVTSRLLQEAAIAEKLHNERPWPAPFTVGSDIADLRALASDARAQIASLATVLVKLDGKIDELEKRELAHEELTKRHLEGIRDKMLASSSSNPSNHVATALPRAEEQLQQRSPRQTDTPTQPRPALTAPRTTTSGLPPYALPLWGLSQTQYLDRYFAERVDLPSRLLCAIMERIHLHVRNDLPYVARTNVSDCREHLKAALKAVVAARPGHQLAQRHSRAFKIVAKELDINSVDDACQLPPSRFLPWKSKKSECHLVYRSTLRFLADLSEVSEIFPPLYRAIIEGLKGGTLCNNDHSYHINTARLQQRVRALIWDNASRDVCDVVKAQETRSYVIDRLEGATVAEALDSVMAKREAAGSNSSSG